MTAKSPRAKRASSPKRRAPRKAASKPPEALASIARQPLDKRRLVALKLTAISRQLWLKFDQRVEKRGLTRAKWILIAAAARAPGATQRTIAAALQVTEVTAGRLIDRLCADGYLERRENPRDRRSYRVYLTRAAQPLLDQLSEIANLHMREAFAGLSKQDLTRLDSLLEDIAHNLGRGQEFWLGKSGPGRARE